MLRIGDDATVGRLYADTLTFPDGTSQSTVLNLGDANTVGTTLVNLTADSKIGNDQIESQLSFVTLNETSTSGSIHRPFVPGSVPPVLQNNVIYTPPDLSAYQTATQVNAAVLSGPTSHVTHAVNFMDISGNVSNWDMFVGTIPSSNGATQDSFGIRYGNQVLFKLANTGTMHVDSFIFAPFNIAIAQQNLSDDRYKSRERDLPDNCLELIKQLRPARYLLHPNHEVPVDVEDSDLTGVETHDQAGLIAQDLNRFRSSLSWSKSLRESKQSSTTRSYLI